MAQVIPFPLIEGAICLVETRRNPHRGFAKPKGGCLCDDCENRRAELRLAGKLEAELRRARWQREREGQIDAGRSLLADRG
jgi:hypothetical protein